MSRIKVNAATLHSSSSSFLELSRSLMNYQNAVNSVLSNLTIESWAKQGLRSSLRNVSNQILDEAARMDSFADALHHVAQGYAETETRLRGLESNAAGGDVHSSTSNGEDKNWYETVKEKIRSFLIELGIKKAKKQERVEGQPVTKQQEREMDLYMKREAKKLRKSDDYSERKWKKASLAERKQMLNDYIASISEILGLPSVKIQWSYEEAENGYATMGYYSSSDNSVHINQWVLENGDSNGFPSYSLLKTVTHEMRHYYQHEAIVHPENFVATEETIQSWQDSYDNYKNTEGFMREGMSQREAHKAYQAQTIEKDARWFADQ